MLFITAIGSSSSGGLAGQAGAILAFLALLIASWFLKGGRINWRVAAASCAVVAAAVAGCFLLPQIRSRIVPMIDKFFNLGGGESPFYFKDLTAEGPKASIITQDGEISIVYDKDTQKAEVSANGKVLSTESVERSEVGSVIATYSFSPGGSFQLEAREGAFAFRMREVTMVFAISTDGTVIPVSRALQVVDLGKKVDYIGFEGMEYFASGRGYIWSRSLPVALGYPIVGAGPDAFSLVFPQNDVQGKMRYMGNPYMVVDKPHNMYLQLAVNTGVLSLAAYLAIIVLFLKDAFPQAALGEAPGEQTWAYALRFGSVAGVCGYMFAALSTDSTVSVSPIFWIALGLGFALTWRAKSLRGGAAA
jgi:hypothetical protein